MTYYRARSSLNYILTDSLPGSRAHWQWARFLATLIEDLYIPATYSERAPKTAAIGVARPVAATARTSTRIFGCDRMETLW